MGITIKDVAAAAGTSVSTVSKVINGHYSISEETAARVRRVMQERQRTELCQRHDQNDCGFSKFSSEHSLSESAYV